MEERFNESLRTIAKQPLRKGPWLAGVVSALGTLRLSATTLPLGHERSAKSAACVSGLLFVKSKAIEGAVSDAPANSRTLREKLAGVVRAIEDGEWTPSLKERLRELEGRRGGCNWRVLRRHLQICGCTPRYPIRIAEKSNSSRTLKTF
jgi:hypothetical protein